LSQLAFAVFAPAPFPFPYRALACLLHLNREREYFLCSSFLPTLHKTNKNMSPAIAETAPADSGRLLLVSNRLPITIRRSEGGKYEFSMSSGGLVTGLSGLAKTTTFQWYGWPGLEVPENEVDTVKTRLREEYGAVPVFIDDQLADRHYNGFSSAWFETL
jgi:trehalose 6-phosphate synthase